MTKKITTLAQASARIEEIERAIDNLEGKMNTRRGPRSLRPMTEDDARRVILGDLKDVSHAEAANKLGLSYGQVYSARRGFTHRYVHEVPRSH